MTMVCVFAIIEFDISSVRHSVPVKETSGVKMGDSKTIEETMAPVEDVGKL